MAPQSSIPMQNAIRDATSNEKMFDGNLNKSKDDASHRRQELINMIEY
jgi:hypothetical protein